MYIECSLFTDYTHTYTGDTSIKCPTSTTNIEVIVAVTIVNIIILLLTISLPAIFVTVLIVKGKKQSLAVNYTEETKGTVQDYDEVDNTVLKKGSSDTNVYEELDVNKMEDRSQYAIMK